MRGPGRDQEEHGGEEEQAPHPSPALRVADQLVLVGHRLDRELRRLQRSFFDQHLLRDVLGRARVVLDGRLELGR